MNTATILSGYTRFKEQTLTDRFLKHDHVMDLIHKLPAEFEVTLAGQSYENRPVNLIKWGNGSTKVFLWSQMHGDEATGTMALFDLFNFLQADLDQNTVELIKTNCTLFILPMVNPDGAARFTRRNAQQVDINRDFNKTLTPEGSILKQVRDSVSPHFGFNLHDQSTLWGVKKTGKSAILSYLAPAYNEELSINSSRESAMLVIADMFKALSPHLPQQIGLFDDEYEPRAFGDNFQKAGTATILIEGGGLYRDPENQEIRKYFFLSLMSGLYSIASKEYLNQDLKNYTKIPKNNKEIFHILIREVEVNGISLSIGINYKEKPVKNGMATTRNYSIEDLGDLSVWGAYHIFQSPKLKIEGEILFDQPANFSLLENDEIILCFKNGILHSKL